jgi:DnaJ-class molecular chaperone
MEDLLGSIFGAGPGFTGRRERRGRDQNATMQVDPMTAILGGDAHITIPRPDGSHEPLKVRIPAGVKNGGKLRLKGQGLPPQGGGACGDLNIRLDIADHPILRRDGDDLEMDVPLTVLEALKGGSITVPTPTGEIKVNVPAGVASGQRLRIKGKGVQKLRNPGDLYLVLRPTVPTTQTPELIAAAEALEAGYGADVRAALVL